MGSLLRYESNNVLLILSILFVCVFGVLSFDNASLFNMTNFLLLVILCILHTGNRDLLSLFMLLGVSRIIGESNAWIYTLSFFNTFEFKIATYLLVFSIACLFRYQLLSLLVIASLGIVVPLEIYWQQSGYSAPAVHLYYFPLLNTIFLRYALLMRAGLFKFLGNVRPQNLDYNISEIMFLSAIVNLMMIAEYLIRHLTGYNILVIYTAYEYIQHSLACMNILIIYYYLIRLYR